MEMTNGMPADDARILDDIALRACALVEKIGDEQLFATASTLEISVGTDWSSAGTSMTYKLPRDLFASASGLRQALARRTREARLTAFPVLAVLDAAAAAPLFGESTRLRHENAHAVSYEANLVRNLWARWQELMALQPPALPAELWLAGKFRFEALTDEQIAAVPAEALRERLPRLDSDALPRVLAAHPTLKSDEARVKLFEALVAERARGRALAVARVLVEGRHPRSADFARSFLDTFGAEDWAAMDLVIATRDRPSLERVFDELAARRARRPLAWDPHHADADLRPAIRAGFALGPKDASARFAPYFAAIASDEDAKIAHDIWLLGTGTAVNHDGTYLPTGDGDLLDLDPGWMITAARFAHHPRLGPSARSLLRRVEAKERKALLAAHALPAPPETKKPKKKTPTKKTPTKKTPTKKTPAKKASTTR